MSDSTESVDDNVGGTMDLTEMSAVVEAMIFASEEPLPGDRIIQVLEDTGEERYEPSQVADLVANLNREYEKTNRAFRIHEWGGGYRMATTAENAPYLKALFYQKTSRKLSRSLMETLAIVAYRQPVTKPEIDFIRGVDSDYAIRRLLELSMIDVAGRSEAVGKPLLYHATRLFMERFGLGSTEDLPNLREVEELLADPAFDKERAQLLMSDGLDPIQTDIDQETHTGAGRESEHGTDERNESAADNANGHAHVSVDLTEGLVNGNGDSGNGDSGSGGSDSDPTS